MNDPCNHSDFLCGSLAGLIDPNGGLVIKAELAEAITNVYNELQKRVDTGGSTNLPRVESALNALKAKLQCVKYLQVYSSYTPDLNYFGVQMYSKITELSVDMCPPSTIRSLFALRQQLVTLNIINSGITDLHKILSPVEKKYIKKLHPLILPGSRVTVPEKYLWSILTTLKLSNCGIAKIDQAMHFFTALKFLDLSHNSISHIIHLQDCISLKHVNLSHNRIRVLSNLERVLGSVTRINVSHNEIESLDGIDKIYSLERFDASHNVLDDFVEVQHLCRLPCLESLVLSDNPIAEHLEYRLKVFNEFIQEGGVMMGNRSFPALDGKMIAPHEQKKLRRLMFRATTDAQVETSYADEKYLNRDIANSGDEDEEDVAAAAPEEKSRGGRGELQRGNSGRLSDIGSNGSDRRKSMELANRGEVNPLARSRMGLSPSKRHSVDGAGVQLGREYSPRRGSEAAEPLSSNAFKALSPLQRARSQQSPADLLSGSRRTASTGGRPSSVSPKRDRLSRNSVAGPGDRRSMNATTTRASLGGRSVSTASCMSNLDLRQRTVFKLPKSERVKRLAIVSYGEKKERYPELAEIEEFVMQIRLREEEEKIRAEALHQQALQQQLLEQRSQLLLSRRMESFSLGPRNMSTDYSEGPRTYSLSQQSHVGHVQPVSSGSSDHHYDQIYPERSYSVISNAPSSDLLRGRELSVVSDSRSVSTAVQPSQLHFELGGDALGRPVAALPAVPASSMDDFKGRINDTTKFSVYTEPAGNNGIVAETSNPMLLSQSYTGSSSLLSQSFQNSSMSMHSAAPISSPAISSSNSRGLSSATPNVILTPATNLAKVTGGTGVNSAMRIKVTNPNQAKEALPLVDENEEIANSGAAAGNDALEGGDKAYGEGDIFDEDMEDDSESDMFEAMAAQHAQHDDEYDDYDEDEDETWGGDADAQRKPSTVYRYIGDPEYRNLSVVDNLELYFREQVFGPDRPSGACPYIQELQSSRSNASSQQPASTESAVVFVKEPSYPERFITIFSERIIDITAEGKTANHGVEGMPAVPDNTTRQRSGSSANQPHNEFVAVETRALLILTDLMMYIVQQDSFSSSQLFGDAPIPVLIRAHPIYALSNCSIFFGFQRCVLGFIDHRRVELKNKGSSAITYNDDASMPVVQQYMILTRDKAHTYPIITRLPQIANAIRSNLKPTPLPNVKIDNKDAQLLEHVMKFISSQGADHDIVHYQMVYQVWRTRPGVKVPRTVILTQNLILLCSEELHTADIGLKVLDSATLRDVFKVYPEDNPLYLTVVFKPTSVFASKRKWRLCTDSRSTVTRLLEECRRACMEKGNNDI